VLTGERVPVWHTIIKKKKEKKVNLYFMQSGTKRLIFPYNGYKKKGLSGIRWHSFPASDF
jgi:hypothetical protein